MGVIAENSSIAAKGHDKDGGAAQGCEKDHSKSNWAKERGL